VVFVPSGTPSLYWESCRAGALAAAEDYEILVRWESPDIAEPAASQRSIVETLIADQPDGLLVCPVDPADLAPLLKRAFESGIAVGLIETPCETPYAVCVRTDAAEAGRLAAQHLASGIGEGGSAAVVSAAGQNGLSKDAFVAALGAMPRPIRVSERRLDFSDEIAALNSAAALLRGSDRIQGIFCAGERATIALARVARRIGKTPPIVGYGSAFSLQQDLRESAIEALVVPDGFQVGYSALEAIIGTSEQALAGPETEISPRLITRDNLDTQEIRAFLDPTFPRGSDLQRVEEPQ
jgi:ribose transport system substrate-binding protein